VQDALPSSRAGQGHTEQSILSNYAPEVCSRFQTTQYEGIIITSLFCPQPCIFQIRQDNCFVLRKLKLASLEKTCNLLPGEGGAGGSRRGRAARPPPHSPLSLPTGRQQTVVESDLTSDRVCATATALLTDSTPPTAAQGVCVSHWVSTLSFGCHRLTWRCVQHLH